MPKADLTRRIDNRPGEALAAGGVRASTSTTGTAFDPNNIFVGRREGPHAGLFRLSNNTILLQVADTAGVPLLSAGGVDYDTNRTWITIGYPNQYGIRLPALPGGPGQPEMHRPIEVDAECLVGMLPPDVIPLAAINTSMIDWGLGADQVSAADVPVADAGGYYSGEDVEAVLQEIGGYLPLIGLCCTAEETTIADGGGYFASTEVEGALQELGGGMAYILANWPAP